MKPANFICVAAINNRIYVTAIDVRNVPEDLETSNNFFVILDNSPEQHQLVESFFSHDISNVVFKQDPLRDFALINVFAEYKQTQQLTNEQRIMLKLFFSRHGYVGVLTLDSDSEISQFIAEDLIQCLQETQTLRRIR